MDITLLEDTAQRVAKPLIANHRTLATAESCTGGLIASALVSVPGVSEVFMEGCVSYANEAKMRTLSVKEETLAQYGAVSEQTAREMAQGIRAYAGTDFGIATTGVAGPGGGTKEKPVGLVYIACASASATLVRKLNLSGTRAQIRLEAARQALALLEEIG